MTHVVGQPSLPGADAGGDEPHVHPVPRRIAVMLLAHSLALASAFVFAGFWVHDQHRHDQQQTRAVAAELERRTQAIADDLERRKTARDAEAAQDRETTRRLTCAVLRDLDSPSVDTRALARQLRCDLPPAVPSNGPAATAPPAPARHSPAAVRRSPASHRQNGPAPAPGRSSQSSRRPSPAARPSPSPSPSACLLGLLCHSLPEVGR